MPLDLIRLTDLRRLVDFSVCVALYLLLGWSGDFQAPYISDQRVDIHKLFVSARDKLNTKIRESRETCIANRHCCDIQVHEPVFHKSIGTQENRTTQQSVLHYRWAEKHVTRRQSRKGRFGVGTDHFRCCPEGALGSPGKRVQLSGVHREG